MIKRCVKTITFRMSETRICFDCKEEKVLNSDNFYRDKNRVKGFTYICKNCNNLRWKNYKESKIQKEQKQNTQDLSYIFYQLG